VALLSDTEPASSQRAMEEMRKSCPADFQLLYYLGQQVGCFKVVTARATWDDAEVICSVYNEKAQLAILDLGAKNIAVKQHLKTLSGAHIRDCVRDAPGSGTQAFWIAAARQQTGICRSPFFWSNGRPLTYSDWAYKLPNCRDAGSVGASCVAMVRPIGYQWNDQLCTRRLCSICEIPL